jgi:hypothetical protein
VAAASSEVPVGDGDSFCREAVLNRDETFQWWSYILSKVYSVFVKYVLHRWFIICVQVTWKLLAKCKNANCW